MDSKLIDQSCILTDIFHISCIDAIIISLQTEQIKRHNPSLSNTLSYIEAFSFGCKLLQLLLGTNSFFKKYKMFCAIENILHDLQFYFKQYLIKTVFAVYNNSVCMFVKFNFHSISQNIVFKSKYLILYLFYLTHFTEQYCSL